MVSDIVTASEYLRDSDTPAGAYQRFVEDLVPANPQDTEQHKSDYEWANSWQAVHIKHVPEKESISAILSEPTWAYSHVLITRIKA